jgi:hypothetical protein
MLVTSDSRRRCIFSRAVRHIDRRLDPIVGRGHRRPDAVTDSHADCHEQGSGDGDDGPRHPA